MSEAVTSCPACSASFRVTEQQLLAAEGSVRCGACLHLFQAEDYLISPMLDVTELLAIESDYWTDFEVYISQVLRPAQDHVDEALPTETSVTGESGSRHVPGHLVQISEPEPVAPAVASVGYWAPTGKGKLVEINPVSIWEQEETASFSEVESEVERSGQEALPTSVFLEDEMLGTVETINLDVTDAPDLISEDRRHLFAASALKWLPGVFAMLVLAFLQYAYLRMEQFAHELRYRPYYETTCHYLGCALPEFHDPSLLQARELVVRPHPTEQDALIVDALLCNSAEYRQLFPNLHLRFFDINGNIVASRSFKASEYLGGEMRGLRFIPGHTEVRLSLEIVDPGEQALGYQMDVVSSAVPN